MGEGNGEERVPERATAEPPFVIENPEGPLRERFGRYNKAGDRPTLLAILKERSGSAPVEEVFDEMVACGAVSDRSQAEETMLEMYGEGYVTSPVSDLDGLHITPTGEARDRERPVRRATAEEAATLS